MDSEPTLFLAVAAKRRRPLGALASRVAFLRTNTANAGKLSRVGAVRFVVALLSAVEASSVVRWLRGTVTSHVAFFLAAKQMLVQDR